MGLSLVVILAKKHIGPKRRSSKYSTLIVLSTEFCMNGYRICSCLQSGLHKVRKFRSIASQSPTLSRPVVSHPFNQTAPFRIVLGKEFSQNPSSIASGRKLFLSPLKPLLLNSRTGRLNVTVFADARAKSSQTNTSRDRAGRDLNSMSARDCKTQVGPALHPCALISGCVMRDAK